MVVVAETFKKNVYVRHVMHSFTILLFNDLKQQINSNEASLHTLYRNLMFEEEQSSYIDDRNSVNMVRAIFRTRTEMLYLNKKAWVTDDSANCALCNLHKPEDILRFLEL